MLLYVDSSFASPYALVAYVSLLEKGLPFDVKPLELFANAQMESSFAATSITRRVPTLIHDGLPYCYCALLEGRNQCYAETVSPVIAHCRA